MTSNLLTENDFHFLNDRLENDICQSIGLSPSSDNRVWKSQISDIYGGDNFADFCKDFFAMLDKEEYWD